MQVGLIRLVTETSISKCNLAVAGQRLSRSKSRSLNLNSKCLDSLTRLRPAQVARYIHEACVQARVRTLTHTCPFSHTLRLYGGTFTGGKGGSRRDD